MYIYMYTYVAKYKYGHMYTTCMILSTSRVIHIICTYTCKHMLVGTCIIMVIPECK